MSGAIDTFRLVTGGRVLIGGLTTGDVLVQRGTATFTLIHLEDGLDTAGNVVINQSRGNYNAAGSIYVGEIGSSTPPPSVVFDGSIMLKDNTGHTAGGNLTGLITVRGCHNTGDLDICICGTNSGTVSLLQSGCTNTVGWSCVSGCP